MRESGLFPELDPFPIPWNTDGLVVPTTYSRQFPDRVTVCEALPVGPVGPCSNVTA